MKLKDFAIETKESNLMLLKEFNDMNKVRWILEMDKLFDIELEDRDIELRDLNCNDGVLYKMMVAFCESAVVIEEDFGFNCFDYSLEDYFRDALGKGIEYSHDLFSVEDIDKQLYNCK